MREKREIQFCAGALILCWALWMSGVGPLAAQQVPATRTLKVNVDLVQFDVTVKDQQGRIVQGLAKEDFAVAEDNIPQEITNFDQGKAPLAIALALDVSGCPPADTYRKLHRAAQVALDSFKEADRITLFTFSTQVQRPIPLTNNRNQIYSFIETLDLDRSVYGSNIAGAVYQAAAYLRGAAPESRRAIILVSEDIAKNSTHSQAEVLSELLEDDVTLYNIQLHSSASGDINVPELVHETGGELFSTMTHTVEEVASALTTIVQRLKLRYTIGYYPSNSVHDGKFRRISVKVKVQQWNPFSGKVQSMDAGYVAGLTKRGYYATDPSQKKKAVDNKW